MIRTTSQSLSEEKLTIHLSTRLVDENDNDVKEGQPGEALLKGPMVTKGYHNNPEANKSSFTADGWFRTGDILKMEGDVLYMVDRKKASLDFSTSRRSMTKI